MVIACAGMLAACGDDAEPEPVARTAPQATATATPTPSPEATPTPTASPTPTATATPEAGDETGNRPRVSIELTVEDVLPGEITVPAFLGLDVLLVNSSGGERIVRLDERVIAELTPGERLDVQLEGLQPGEHTLSAGESGRAKIVAERAG